MKNFYAATFWPHSFAYCKILSFLLAKYDDLWIFSITCVKKIRVKIYYRNYMKQKKLLCCTSTKILIYKNVKKRILSKKKILSNLSTILNFNRNFPSKRWCLKSEEYDIQYIILLFIKYIAVYYYIHYYYIIIISILNYY
jgi:hypothetical protein